jgi:hypothetical protein
VSLTAPAPAPVPVPAPMSAVLQLHVNYASLAWGPCHSSGYLYFLPPAPPVVPVTPVAPVEAPGLYWGVHPGGSPSRFSVYTLYL